MDSFEKFIVENGNADTVRLVMACKEWPRPEDPELAGLDAKSLAVNTIEGRRRLRKKLPEWVACTGLVYPSSLCAEQCSSSDTARYKASIVQRIFNEYIGTVTSMIGEPCRTTCSAANKMKSKAELRAEYSKIQEELNKALEGMLPPVGSTPQEQRNYFSARKLPVEKVILTKGREAWVCNFCGCWHNCPSECCEPWHGGKWVYEYKEEKILDFK